MTELVVVEKRLAFHSAGQSVERLEINPVRHARLDKAIEDLPSLRLFRRADSFTAHPTAQGLNLRGIGASAAGRVLVTLDGVPLNDPFGGWVYWSALSAVDVETATLFKGGRSGALAPQALAGALALTSRTPTQSGGRARLAVGRFESYEASANVNHVHSNGYLSVGAAAFDTDGPFLLKAADRGPVDARAASDMVGVYLRGQQQFLSGYSMRYSIAAFEENRVNGLPLARNETRALDASATLMRRGVSAVDFEATAYYRTRDFENIFASVRDMRTSERAVLDQFDLPAKELGLAVRFQSGGIEWGLDGRHLSGATNERFRNLGAGFTRERRAGGDQWVAGGYLNYADRWGDTALAFGLRLDRYRIYEGQRQEQNLESDATVLDVEVPARSSWQPSARLGLNQALSPIVQLEFQAYRSWRLPTINELFRPFRVVNDITEANADLVPEKLYGLDLALEVQLGEAVFRLGAYRAWLMDGVGNITIGFGPGAFPVAGFVPAGGVLRQRANIDRQIIDGIELSLTAPLTGGLHIAADYRFARARVTAFAANPALEGRRPAQTPRHLAKLRLAYEQGQFSANLDGHYLGVQFDDDLNARRLGDAFTVDASAAYRLRNGLRLFIAGENIFDATVVSALSSTGLETVARRASWRVGVIVDF